MESNSIIYNLDRYDSDLRKLTELANYLFDNEDVISDEQFIKELSFINDKLDQFFSIYEESNILDLIEVSGGLNEYLVKNSEGIELVMTKSELIERAEAIATSQGFEGYGKIACYIHYKHNSYYNIVKIDIESLYLDTDFIERLKSNAVLKK